MLSEGCPYDTSFNACQRTSTKGHEGKVPLGLFPLIDEPKVSGTAPVPGGPRNSGIREVTDEEGDDAELKPAIIMETHLPYSPMKRGTDDVILEQDWFSNRRDNWLTVEIIMSCLAELHFSEYFACLCKKLSDEARWPRIGVRDDDGGTTIPHKRSAV